ncbi:ATP-binding protein [Pseudophaeobacter leonis]|uniref:ATP-binding protein n=1 Tax=Pseudophaeobacter leonis TaxID=1144477 RepID=UPI001374752C|nr:transporter substrate-binding domain-containing protein [Pseudophaeobacter leonis]
MSFCALQFSAACPVGADTLRVAQYENPPTIFRNKDNVPSGFWPEMTEAVLGNLEYDIEYVDCLWAVCLEMLEAGEIDLMPDIAYTAERAGKFQFVEQPLLYSWFAIVVAANVSFETLDDFEGKRIAVLANSIQEQGITEHLRRQEQQAHLVWASSMEGVLEAVSQGDADIGIVNRFIAASDTRDEKTTYLAQIPFGTYSLHFAASPDMELGVVDAINLEVFHQQTTFRSAFQHASQRWATIVPLPLPFWVLAMLATALAFLVLAGVFLFTLRRLVARRTRSLAVAVADLEHQIVRKQAEAYAVEAQKMDALGRMVGGVAHDFNNLLAVIMGNLELMPDKCDTDPDFAEFRSGAIRATKRGATLVRDLLSFGRRASLSPQLIEPMDVLQNVHKMIARVFPANITLRVPEAPETWMVKLDRGQLENALLNLALNAKDAMPQGGTLTISCANVTSPGTGPEITEQKQVRITISDTGVGMTEETRAKVCEPFFTTKEVGKGSGMGLAMVHGFVKQSSGDLTITSAPDAGTTIELTFPAAQDASLQAIASDTATPPKLGRGKILLIEDNEMLLPTLSRQIKTLGYDVVTATSGQEALSHLARDQTFDLVISDVVMPGPIQGTDVARAVDALDSNIPVLLITGYAGDALEDLATSGKYNVLTKPVSQNDLSVAIHRTIRDAQAADTAP